ncbi:hypothetical protein EJ02DRAFT_508601 [Clathrospora elynae]|uniref:RanBP2-type domain-containing protein n=1 Tax=Clathrospora elynae TaxID=706981 RepID=A0A6A5T281_9PLEO|nr:hypothetical protein EJ02DRAFT_508601 [Clathrospora elynae]
MSAARPKFGPSLKKHLKHILPLQKHARSLGQLLITSNKPTTPDGHDIMNKEEAALKDARDKKRKHQPTNEAEPKPGKKGAPKAKKPKKEYVPWVGDWKCAICGYWNIPFSATCNGNCRDPDDETEGPCYGKRRRDTEFEQADEEAPREIRRGLCNTCGRDKNSCCEYEVQPGQESGTDYLITPTTVTTISAIKAQYRDRKQSDRKSFVHNTLQENMGNPIAAPLTIRQMLKDYDRLDYFVTEEKYNKF